MPFAEQPATEVTAPAAPIVDATATTTEAAPASATTTEATSTDTTTTATDDGSTQQEPERDEKGQFSSKVQKRIDDLTYRRNAAEREAQHWKQVAESRAPAAAPKASDFATDDEYNDAVLEHRIDSRVNDGLARTAAAQADKFSHEASTAAGEAYNQRVAEVVSRLPDFVEVVSKADIAISPALQEALRDSDKGPDLVYHLAKNPGLAEQLNAMSVRQMDREIGRLESTIGTKAAPTPPAARTTNAPPPVKPGSPAAGPANTDPAKMSQGEFEQYMRASGSKYV